MMTKQDAKESIDMMAKLVEQIGVAEGYDPGIGHGVKIELAKFLMYLSASDGEIMWPEASLISELCDLNLTPQTIGRFVKENNIYSTEFENTPPAVLQVLTSADNMLMERGSDVPDVLRMIINTYKAVAAMLITSDGDIDSSEKADYQIYIDMMESYVASNSIRYRNQTSGFTKNSGDASAPTKGGVSAPKKKG